MKSKVLATHGSKEQSCLPRLGPRLLESALAAGGALIVSMGPSSDGQLS